MMRRDIWSAGDGTSFGLILLEAGIRREATLKREHN